MKMYARALPVFVLLLCLASAGRAEAPEIRAGTELDFRPYCFTDALGRPAGFGVDLLLNQGLRIVKASGEYNRIYGQRLAAEVPPSVWWGYFWRVVGIIGILILIAVTWYVARRVFETDMRRAETLVPQSRSALSAFWRYALAALAIIAGHAMRIGIEAWVGPGLPTFITYYPAVMIAALLGGIGPGLTAIAVTLLIASIFLMPPIGSPEVDLPVDRVALVLYFLMGLLMTAFAELYRRTRTKAAAFDRDAALRESEERFRALTETSSLAVGVTLSDGTFLYINKAFENLFCFAHDELSRVNAAELWLNPEDRLAMIDATMSRGSLMDYEVELRRKDGTTFWALLSVNNVDYGGKQAIMASVNDITDRKAAEAALRESEEKFKIIATNTPDHILVQDDQLRYEQVINPQLGLTESDMIGKTDRDFLAEADAAELTKIKKQVLASGKAEHVKMLPLESRDGSIQYFEGSYIPRQDAGGRINGIIGYFRNVTDRRAAEEALKESEERLRLAASAAELGVFEWDIPSDKAQWENERMFEIFGRTHVEGPVGREAFYAEALEPEDRYAFDQALSEAMLPGRLFNAACRIRRRNDGRQRWIEYSARFDLASDGSPLRLVGVLADITERKHAEEALRESEEQFRVLTQNLQSGVALIDGRGSFIIVNTSFLRMFDLSPDADILNINSRDWSLWQVFNENGALLDIDEHPVRKAALTRTAMKNRLIAVRTPSRDDLKWLLVSAEPILDALGNVHRLICTYYDITELRAAEEALRRNEARWNAAIESFAEGAIIATEDEQVIYWNPAARIMHGFTRPEEGIEPLERTPVTFQLLTPDGSHMLELDEWPMRRIKRGETVRDLELRIRRPDQGWEKIFSYSGVMLNTAGDERLIFLTCRDLTELREAEKVLHERTEALARSNEDLQQFAYVASHDLQEPLRAVSGFLKLLEERYRPQLDDKAREFIGFAVDGAVRMTQLVRDLLEYSRISSKGKELGPADAELALSVALANLRGAIRESGAAITHESLPFVTGDQTQLMQLFQNLIGNSIKFRSTDRPCRVHVTARRAGDLWEFAVRDNGIGVPADLYDRIFVIFQRLHARDKYAGTGIGLAICKKIVERHGGKIWIESRLDEGATFFFTLPQERP